MFRPWFVGLVQSSYSGDCRMIFSALLPSGKRLQKTMERSTMLLMGKSTISMAIFNSYACTYLVFLCPWLTWWVAIDFPAQVARRPGANPKPPPKRSGEAMWNVDRAESDLPGVIAAVALLLSRDTGYERRRNVYWNLLRNEVGEGYMSLHYIYIHMYIHVHM